jgi:hypothetical protein
VEDWASRLFVAGSSLPQPAHYHGYLLAISSAWEAERVFQKSDPTFEFSHLPVEIRLGDEAHLMFQGRPRIQSYNVWVEHGFYRGLPGVDECVAISLAGSCPDTAAIASAQLMDSDAIEVRKWDTQSRGPDA